MPNYNNNNHNNTNTNNLFIYASMGLGICLLLSVYMFQEPSPFLPWHETPQWNTLLNLYQQRVDSGYYSSKIISKQIIKVKRNKQQQNVINDNDNNNDNNHDNSIENNDISQQEEEEIEQEVEIEQNVCKSHYIDTTYGTTHVFACGNVHDTPVLIFPDGGSNALLFDSWLVPTLVQHNYYTLVVDYVCDVGRSKPLKKAIQNIETGVVEQEFDDLKNCPKRDDEVGYWVRQVLLGILGSPNNDDTNTNNQHANTFNNQNKKVSLIGYAYGCQLALMTARFQSSLVDQLIFMAPTAIVAPIQWNWIWNSIWYCVLNSSLPNYVEFLKTMSVLPPQQFDEISKPILLQTLQLQSKQIGESPEQSNGNDNQNNNHIQKDNDNASSSSSSSSSSFSSSLSFWFQLLLTIRTVNGATILPVGPQPYDTNILQPIISQHKTLLQIGQEETVIDVQEALKQAQAVGMETIVYANAGHLFFLESDDLAFQIANDIVTFLKEENNNKNESK